MGLVFRRFPSPLIVFRYIYLVSVYFCLCCLVVLLSISSIIQPIALPFSPTSTRFLPNPTKMVSSTFLAAGVAALAHSASAVSVSGTPEGFAASVTGGGDAEAVYPTSTDELYVLTSQCYPNPDTK